MAKFGRNIHSQFGEDGIIAEVFRRVPHVSWCVEFGAWDGLHLSNTAHLLLSKDWSGILIEGHPERFAELCMTYADFPKAHCLNFQVSSSGPNALDAILGDTPAPRDFDLLVIDIDGNDYHIWKSLITYRPKIVLIEFNNEIHHTVEYVQPDNNDDSTGSSLCSFHRLGLEKGYQLIAATESNAFFADEPLFPLFHMDHNTPHGLNACKQDGSGRFPCFAGCPRHPKTTGKRNLNLSKAARGSSDIKK
jgi:hypothetical protein